MGAVCGVWEGAVRRCWSVLAAMISDIWRCVCVLCVRCVGSLALNKLGEEAGKAIAAALQHTPNMQKL